MADAGFTSPELFVLLRTDGRNAAGLEIPFQPHLLRVGGAVSGPRGNGSVWWRACLARNAGMGGRAGGRSAGAAGLRSHRADAGARIPRLCHSARRADAVRAICDRSRTL